MLYYNTHFTAVEYQIRILISIVAIYKIVKNKNLDFNIENLENTVIAIIKVFETLV